MNKTLLLFLPIILFAFTGLKAQDTLLVSDYVNNAGGKALIDHEGSTNHSSAKTKGKTGSIELVFDNSAQYEIGGSPGSSCLSLFNNEVLLLATIKMTTDSTSAYNQIFMSTDEGKKWESIFRISGDSLGSIYTIKQTSKKEVLIYYHRLEEDSTALWGWSRKYYLAYSNDLCKTWTSTDLDLPFKRSPSQMQVLDNQVLFTASTEKGLVLWHSKNNGATWTTKTLGKRFTYGEPKIINSGQYALLFDSIYFTKDLQKPKWESEAAQLNFTFWNTLFLSKDRFFTASPQPSGIGHLQRTYIAQKSPENGWEVKVDTLESEPYVWSRRGLFEHAHFGDEFLAFVGPNLIYTSTDGGDTWLPFYVDDDYWTASRGVVCMKNKEKKTYHLFYPLATTGQVLKYSTPAPSSVNKIGSLNDVVSVFPNPTTNLLNIVIDSEVNQLESIRIYNTSGKLVKLVDNLIGNAIAVNSSSLPQGIYYAEIKTTNGVSLKRFVQQ